MNKVISHILHVDTSHAPNRLLPRDFSTQKNKHQNEGDVF